MAAPMLRRERILEKLQSVAENNNLSDVIYYADILHSFDSLFMNTYFNMSVSEEGEIVRTEGTYSELEECQYKNLTPEKKKAFFHKRLWWMTYMKENGMSGEVYIERQTHKLPQIYAIVEKKSKGKFVLKCLHDFLGRTIINTFKQEEVYSLTSGIHDNKDIYRKAYEMMCEGKVGVVTVPSMVLLTDN